MTMIIVFAHNLLYMFQVVPVLLYCPIQINKNIINLIAILDKFNILYATSSTLFKFIERKEGLG